MQPNRADIGVASGKVLRGWIKQHKEQSGESYIALSRKIGMDDNYIASYVRRSASQWSMPKHPTLGYLLNALGKSHDDFDAEIRQRLHQAGL